MPPDHPPASLTATPASTSNRRLRWWPWLLLLLGALLWLGWHHSAPAPGAGADLGQALLAVVNTLLSSPVFWTAVLVGACAQLIDGAVGMAYGISSTTFLIGTGASPATASAAVHIAEVFTTAASGTAHWRLGNVDRALFRRLVLPGMLGGVAGAWLLTNIDGDAIKPWVSAYLLALGLFILVRAARGPRVHKTHRPPTHALAAAGGFLDATGGGGWGPLVTSTLLGQGRDPRTTIGTVNSAEFFIALATGGAFLLLGTAVASETVAGLVLGGMLVAPFAAWLTRHLPARLLLGLVGTVVSSISAFNLLNSLT